MEAKSDTSDSRLWGHLSYGFTIDQLVFDKASHL